MQTRSSTVRRPLRSGRGAVDSPARRRLPPLLRQAWFSLNQAFRRRLSPLGLTPDQFTALRILIEGAPAGLTQRELTEQMSSDPNTVAALAGRLERLGWVERHADPRDRRAKRLAVRPAGRVRFAEARAVAAELQTDVLSALPTREREWFLERLHAVAESCRAARRRSRSHCRRGG